MAKLLDGTRIYGTANVDTQIYVGTFGTTNSTYITNTSISVGNSLVNTIINTSNVLVGAISSTTNGALISNNLIRVGNTSVYSNVAPGLLVVGTSFIANSSQVTITGVPLSANGSVGSATQVLTSNGATGSPYWAAAAGGFSSADDTSTNATYYPLVVTTSGGSTARTSSTKLTFNPSTGTFSATTFTSLSDANQKENIDNISNALDIICKLQGVSFNWKDGGNKSYGVVAQDVEQVIPEIVIEQNNNKTVNYDAIIGFLIEAVKELSVRVQELENK